jgi:hypothetical protein
MEAEEGKYTMNDFNAMDSHVDDTKLQGHNGYDDYSDDASVMGTPTLPVNAQNVSGFHVSKSTVLLQYPDG